MDFRSLEASLRVDPDYSVSFTRKIAALRGVLESNGCTPCFHDDNMDYASGQLLRLFLARSGECTSPQEAHYCIGAYISSCGPYFAWRAWENRPDAWVLLESFPDVVRSTMTHVDTLLEEHGLSRLEGQVLETVVPGRMTRLEGKPATVFEVLFSEL